MADLDLLDFQILNILKTNSQKPLKEIAEQLDSKASTIHARIKKLEQKGIIKNYTIYIDYNIIGYPLVAFIMLNFDKTETNLPQDEVAKQMANLPIVQEVHLIAGEYDIILKVTAKDIDDLGQFVTKTLKKIKGVGSSRTFVSLNKIKEYNQDPFLINQITDEQNI
ncbi:MAG: Lrp/AsnC family transcriptional regulator [Candidatus Heimdallarchaeota archaeon]|nr:Lrp/AsnC family transcriptional regulator [Candidatus Heimdallarchaeota archaeon]MDH5644572.1 Lrp/AsnC family transcriptional regulator [Candidatus Heimdallarchaeota archaeon]